MSKLYQFKKNPILTNSTYKVKAYDEADIAVAMHLAGDKKLVGIFSFKDKKAEVPVDLADGTYQDLLTEESVTVADGKIYCEGRPIIIEA